MLNSTKDCLEIPNLNEKLHNNLLSGITNINKEEIESCQKECEELKGRFIDIESIESTKKINQYIRQTVSRLEAIPERNDFYKIIIESLKNVNKKADNFSKLRYLNDIMIEVPAIEALCRLKNLIEEHKTHNLKQLSDGICKEINSIIETFYAEVPEDIDEHLKQKLKISGASQEGKAVALLLAHPSLKGSEVGRLLGDVKPENLEPITSKTRKKIRSDKSNQMNIEFSEIKNNNSTLIALLMRI